MSISKQLLAMLLIAILGLIGVLGISIQKMETVYQKTNTCNVDALPSVLILSDALFNASMIRVLIWQHIAQDDLTVMQKIEDDLEKRKQLLEESLKKYEPFISDDTDKEFLQKDRVAVNAYLQLVDKAIVFSKENKREASKDIFFKNPTIMNAMTNSFVQQMEYKTTSRDGCKRSYCDKRSCEFAGRRICYDDYTSCYSLWYCNSKQHYARRFADS